MVGQVQAPQSVPDVGSVEEEVGQRGANVRMGED